MIAEGRRGFHLVDVPQIACGISRTRQDGPLVEKTATRQVSFVSVQFLRSRGEHITGFRELVHGAHVIETSARYELSFGRFVSARHDPRRPQRNRVQLGLRERVPHDELSVLRSGD